MSPEDAAAVLSFTTSTGLTLAADAYGNTSDTPVLLLHGAGQTRRAWRQTCVQLAQESYYAVALDQRGHGESDYAADGDYSLDRFRQDAVDVVAQLPGKPAIVGASLGGITGLTAERDNKLCTALVMVDVTPRMNIDGLQRIVGFMGAHAEGFESLEHAANAIAEFLPHRPRALNTDGLRTNLRLRNGRFYWHWDPVLLENWDVRRYTHDKRVAQREEFLQAAASLTVPTLLVRGQQSEVVDMEGVEEFLEHVPHAEFVNLEGARHMVAGDRNDAFAASVIEFLNRTLRGHEARPSTTSVHIEPTRYP